MLTRFIFDGIESSEYGITCALLDSDYTDSNTVTFDVKELLTERSALNDRWVIYSNNYTTPITFTLNLFNSDFSNMDINKARILIKWLCKQNEYSYFQTLDDDYFDIWFHVILTNPEYITMNGQIVGIKLTAYCDAPYGYSEEKSFSYDINTTKTFTIFCESDKASYLYPYVTLSLPAIPNVDKLTIQNNNDIEHRTTELKNLFSNEIIVLDNENKIASSTQPNKVCLSSFNKQWIRLCNGENIFTVNGTCKFNLRFREIRRVGVIA